MFGFIYLCNYFILIYISISNFSIVKPNTATLYPKFDKLLKLYHGAKLIKSWSHIFEMVCSYGNVCSSISAPFEYMIYSICNTF